MGKPSLLPGIRSEEVTKLAERRMFSKTVISSARFLRMPPTSRLLYFDLGMEADDDGCVEAFGVMRKTGATEDDLRVLASKGFVRVLNDDFVSYILDWHLNNQIRKDRYHESVYKSLLNGECAVVLGDGSTNGQPTVNQMETEVRLGKVRLGKSSIGEENIAAKPPTRSRFTPPTVDDVRMFCEEHGYIIDPQRFIDFYESNGWRVGKNPMKSWQAAVRSWNSREQQTPNKPAQTGGYVHGMDKRAQAYKEEFGE